MAQIESTAIGFVRNNQAQFMPISCERTKTL